MYCRDCGEEVSEDASHCEHCGASIPNSDDTNIISLGQPSESETVPFGEWAYGFRTGRPLLNLVVGLIYWFTIFISSFLLLHAWLQNRNRASEVSGNGVKFLVVLSIIMYGFVGISVIAEEPGETVADIETYEQTTESFEANEGDLLQIRVTQPDADGVRTHMLLRGPDGMIMSEGVLDEKEFEYEVPKNATYSVTMTPADDRLITSGQVEVTLIKADERQNS